MSATRRSYSATPVTIAGGEAESAAITEGAPGIPAAALAERMACAAEARSNLRNDATKESRPFRAIGIPYAAPD